MQNIRWQGILSIIVIFALIGFIGSLPVALIAAILFGGAVGGDVLLFTMLLLGSWLPLMTWMNPASQSNGNVLSRLIPNRFSPFVIVLASLAATFLIPILWSMTGTAFLVTVMGYILTGQNLLLTLGIALLAQMGFIYLSIQRGATLPTMQVMTRVEDMQDNFNVNTVTLSSDDVSVRQDESRSDDTADNDDEPKVRYLTDGNDDDVNIPPPEESRTTYDNDSRTAE